MGDYPIEYVLIGQLQETLKTQYYYDLYAKKIDDKYYYLIGKQKQHNVYYGCDIQYYQPEFSNEIINFKDATKDDYSSYNESECILNQLYFKKYLIKLEIDK